MNNSYLKREFISDRKLIILAVTKKCNLSCEYCRKHPGAMYDVLSKNSCELYLKKDLWHNIIKIAKSNNVAEIMITGGEPFEYPYLLELCTFLIQNNIHVSIHTNGVSSQCERIIEEIASKELDIDFHLSTELFSELQRELRGCELPINFIKRAISADKSIELKVTITSRMLEYKEILLKKLYEWVDLGIESIRFQPVIKVNDAMRAGIELTEDSIVLIDMIEEFMISDYRLKDVIRNKPASFDATRKVLRNEKIDQDLIDQCCAQNAIIFIQTDEKVGNCKTIWNKKDECNCIDCFDLVCCGFLS